MTRLILEGVATLGGWLGLFYVDWKIATPMFFIVWGNNLLINRGKK